MTASPTAVQSNFAFMQEHEANFFQLASRAELAFASDSNACGGKKKEPTARQGANPSFKAN